MREQPELQNFLFIGDGINVLKFMHDQGLKIVGAHVPDHIAHDVVSQVPIPNTHLLTTKQALVKQIASSDFDVLVSCGHPHILPISKLRKPHQSFVNVHSSALPKLRGPYPLSGALLEGSGAGATLHHMNDEIDAGPIVSQLSIPVTPELDLGLLDHIVGNMQVRVLEMGLERGFTENPEFEVSTSSESYYRIERKHLEIDFLKATNDIIQQIKAFSSKRIGARFRHRGDWFTVLRAEFLENDYLRELHKDKENGEVICIYDSTVVMVKDSGFLKLQEVFTQNGQLNVGDNLITSNK